MNITTIIKKWVRMTYMYLCYLTRPKKEKSVYFASFRGQYSDNPRAISECLHRMAPDVKIVWMVRPKIKQFVPDYVTTISPSILSSLKAQAQANVWVMNFPYRKSRGVYKGRDQYYIQTWHGDRGLKAVGYLCEDLKEKGLVGFDLSACDLFVAGSEYGVRKARQAFHYNGEVIVEGMPRNDKLVNSDQYHDEAAEVKRHLGIDNDVKVMLYAPTFRDSVDFQQCTIDLDASIANLEANGEKWVCLVRSHAKSKGFTTPNSQLSTANSQLSTANYKDVTSYPDMADLLLIADLLITDYSSSAGDFILTGKPLVLAHFDRNEYETKDRTLWINPDEAGYLVAKNQDELNQILSHLYSYNHQAIADKIKSFYGTKETGQSSKAVVQRILKELNGK